MNRKAAFLVILVFLLGVGVGALGSYVTTSRVLAGKPRGQARVVEQLTRDLGLSAQQQEQLTAILDETKDKYHAVYEQVRPQMEEIRSQGRQKIRGILNAEQLPKFAEYLRKLDEERKRMDEERQKKR